MNVEDFVNTHFFSLFLINVAILVFAIGIFNVGLAYGVGILGTLILCFIDYNERKK